MGWERIQFMQLVGWQAESERREWDEDKTRQDTTRYKCGGRAEKEVEGENLRI